jgi:GTP cyclohydrolase I
LSTLAEAWENPRKESARSWGVLIDEERTPLHHDAAVIERAVHQLLLAIGEDPDREGLRETPGRVARALREICWGVGREPEVELDTFFHVESDEMVVVKDIPFYSLCEHHLLPFIGRAHVAYIPREGRVTGLSKVARVVELAARRLQLQERLTTDVADAMMHRLQPQGVVACIEAEHLCMTMRGIQRPGTVAVTSAVRGIFLEDAATRAEALALLGWGGQR